MTRGYKSLGLSCMIVALVLLFNNCVLADEVILVNGDRLTGRIVGIMDNILTLETSYSEPVKLKFEAVDRMSSSEPVEIHLTDGEILKGRITGEANRKIVIESGPGRDKVSVSFDTIAALNPPPKKPVTWKGIVTLGGNWQDGNSDTLNMSAGALAKRRTDKDRFQINVLYNLAKDSGQRTAENTYGQMKYDYFLNPKWYLYLNVDMLADQFKDINLRTSVGPGAGYQIWEEEGRALSLEAGISYTSEDHDLGEDKDWVTARLGADFLYRLFDRIIFTDQLVIYPSLDNGGEYTLRNDAALVTDIWAGIAMRLNNIWERKSDPGPDLQKDDFTWIVGLQYSF
jgi:putative salt-induced outer membrane protein YdiY/sRNA-binding regulator protein Hfq